MDHPSFGALVRQGAERLRRFAPAGPLDAPTRDALALAGLALGGAVVVGGTLLGRPTSPTTTLAWAAIAAQAVGSVVIALRVASRARRDHAGLTALVQRLARTEDDLHRTVAQAGAGARNVAAQAAALSVEATTLARAAQSQAGDTEGAAAILEDLVTSMHQVARNAESLASGMGETCASVAELVASIEQVGGHVAEAYRRESEATKIAEGGRRMVTESIAGMARIEAAMGEILTTIEALSRSSDEIGAITSLIDDIADQTNLLALNATIEAARAGDHGRGFAVVAQEVKRLADGSVKATQDIGLRLQGIQRDTQRLVASTRAGSDAVRDGVSVTRHAGEALDAIVAAVTESATLMQQIAQATEEQKLASGQITTKVESMSHMTQRVSKATDDQRRGSEQIVSAVESLNAAALGGVDSAAGLAGSVEALAREGRTLLAAIDDVAPSGPGELTAHVAQAAVVSPCG